MTATSKPERIAIGYVVRAKGVRGEVGVQSLTWDRDRFARLDTVQLERDGEPPRCLHLEDCRLDHRGPLLKFRGIDTPEAVRAELVGGYLTVPAAAVPPLPAGRWYVFELVGCGVYDERSGECLGELVEVLEMPSTDVYVVRRPAGGDVLVPAVRDIVRQVDPDGRRIVVAGVEELFDDDG